MILKFVIILQNLIKAYHRKSGKSKYDRKLTELDVETTWIRSRANGVSVYTIGTIGVVVYTRAFITMTTTMTTKYIFSRWRRTGATEEILFYL